MAEKKRSAGQILGVVAGLTIGVPVVVSALAAAAMAGMGAALGSTALAALGAQPGASQLAANTVSPTSLALYRAGAASGCPGMEWTLLAAVGSIESANGTSALAGVHSGASSAGAEGPMQFEPATFAAYDTPTPPGGANPPSPYDMADAIYAAARYLCSLGVQTDPTGALVAYNCGNDSAACQAASGAYAAQAEALASSYAAIGPGAVAASGALGYARSQLGVAYQWGGESPGVAFDCSGLAQWAYAQSGVSIPRTAEQQWSTLAHVAAPAPGDLVFFGSGNYASHVGIYAGNAQMIDAPDTGSVVRYDTIPTTPGRQWGSDTYLGAAT